MLERQGQGRVLYLELLQLDCGPHARFPARRRKHGGQCLALAAEVHARQPSGELHGPPVEEGLGVDDTRYALELVGGQVAGVRLAHDEARGLTAAKRGRDPPAETAAPALVVAVREGSEAGHVEEDFEELGHYRRSRNFLRSSQAGRL